MTFAAGRRAKSPLKQWLVDARGDMKHPELIRLLTNAGYRTRDGEPVKETTIRGWEAPSGGDPPVAVIPYLERVFHSKAPTDEPVDLTDLIRAIRDQTDAISRLASALELRVGPPSQEEVREAADRIVRAAEEAAEEAFRRADRQPSGSHGGPRRRAQG